MGVLEKQKKWRKKLRKERKGKLFKEPIGFPR